VTRITAAGLTGAVIVTTILLAVYLGYRLAGMGCWCA